VRIVQLIILSFIGCVLELEEKNKVQQEEIDHLKEENQQQSNEIDLMRSTISSMDQAYREDQQTMLRLHNEVVTANRRFVLSRIIDCDFTINDIINILLCIQ
jgi:hypothetical protein